MTPPKLLPWIARKAMIPEELALKLWRRAAGEAEARVGDASSPDYCATAVHRWLALVEDEAGGWRADGSAGLGWIWHYQKRMAIHSLTLFQAAWRWWHHLWRRLREPSCTAP